MIKSDPDRTESGSRMGPLRKTLRRIMGMGVRVFAVVCLLGLLLLGLLQFDGVSTWLVSGLGVRFNPYPGTQLTVDRVSGSWIRSLRFEGVRLTPLEGREQGGPEIVLDSLDVRFRLLPLLVRRLEIRGAEIMGLRAELAQRPDSLWDFLLPFQGTGSPDGREERGGGFRLRSGPIRVEQASGRVSFASGGPSVDPDRLEIDDLVLAVASLEVGPGELVASLDTLHARFLPPGEALDRVVVEGRGSLAEGRLVIPGFTLRSGASDVSAEGTLLLPRGEDGEVDEIDFHFRAAPLALRDLSGFIRTLNPTVSAQADLSVRGRASRVDVSGNAAFSDGGRLGLEGAFTPSASGPVEYRLEATAEGLRLGSFLGEGPIGGVVDGRVAVEMEGDALAHLQGDASARVEGLRLDGRGIRPLVVSGGFFQGQASLEVEAGADGLGAVHLTVGGHPLDAHPTLLVQGTFRQTGLPDDPNESPLERAGIQGLEARFALDTRGFSADSAVAGLEMETLGGFYKGLSLEGGSLRASWNGGEGTFDLSQPLGTGRVATTGEMAWREDAGAGGETGRSLSYSLPDLQLRELDLFRLLGDTVPSRVNADVALAGSGTNPGTLDADVLIHLRESEFRGIALDSAVGRNSLEAGALSAVVEGWLGGTEEASGGRVMASLRGRPFDAEPVLVLDSLQFSGIDLTSIAGLPSDLNGLARARMEGLDPRAGTLSGQLDLSPSRIRTTLVDSGEVLVSLSDGDLQVSGQITSVEGIVRLKGSAYPFAEPLEFRLEEGEVRELNLGPLLGQAGLDSKLNLDLSLSGSGNSLRELETLGNVVVLPSTLNQGTLQGGTIALEARAGQGTVLGQLRTGEGEVTLHAIASLAAGLDDLRAEGEVNVPDLGGFLGRTEAGMGARGNMVVTWTPESGMAFTSELEARIGEATIDSLTLRGSFVESALRLDTLRLRSDILFADGGGRWALRDNEEGAGGSDLRVTASVLDLSPLGPLLGLGELAARSGRGELHVTGSAGSPSLAASLELGPWLVSKVSGDSARVTASYDPDGIALAMWAQAQRGLGSIDLALRADPGAGRKSGVLERLDISTTGTHWALDAQVPFSWKDGSRVEGLVLLSDQGRISLDGGIDHLGTQDLSLTLEEASLSGLARFLGLDNLSLLVDGRMDLTGPAESPRGEGDLRVDLASREAASATAAAHFSLADGALALDAQAVDSAGGRLTLKGSIPLALSLVPEKDTISAANNGSVDLTLQSEAFDISWIRALFPQGKIRALEGILSVDARVAGSSDHPVLEGQIGLNGGLIRLPAMGTTFREIDLSADLRDQGIRITRASITSSSGAAEIQGSLVFRGLGLQEMDLTASLDRFLAWNTSPVSAILTGDLRLQGPIEEPRLAGNLDLEGSKIGLDDVSSGSEVQAVELTEEDYRMLEDYFGYRPERREVRSSDLMERLGMELSLSFDRDVWVSRSRQPRLALEVRGDLEIRKDPKGELQAIGTVETLPERSYFREFGRRFAVQEGELTLTGNPSEFSFRMDAQWEVSSRSNPDEAEVVVNLEVAGDAESLKLTLSSDPEMDEADIVSYLATGKPQSDLASSDADEVDIAGLGASMAAGAMSGVLEGWASEAVDLDVVEIKVDPVKGPTLTAGRYVSPDLYLGFRQAVNFSGSSKRDRTQNQDSEVELEYRWFRWLTVNVLASGASELRLFLRARYAY